MNKPYEPEEIPDRCPTCGMSSNPYEWEDCLRYEAPIEGMVGESGQDAREGLGECMTW